MRITTTVAAIFFCLFNTPSSFSQDSLNVERITTLYNYPYATSDIAYEANKLFVVQRDSGLRVLDLEDISNPIELGRFFRQSRMRQIVINDSLAYINLGDSAVSVLSISDPQEIQLISRYQVYGSYNGLFRKDTILFLASEFGVEILSLIDPINPEEIRTFQLDINPIYVYVFGNIAFAVNVITDVVVLDISDPTQPVQISTIPTPGRGFKLTMSGNLLFIADMDNGMRVYNMAFPADPQLIETYNTNGRCYDVAVTGSYVYVADNTEGLRILDISNIDFDEITEIGYYNSDRNVTSLELGNDGVIFAGEGNSLGIYQFNPVHVSSQHEPHIPTLLSLSSFPSPFNSSTLVTFSSPYLGEARASLRDVTGREIAGWVPAYAGTRSGSPGEVRFIIDGTELSAGTYWLKVEQGRQSASTRLVLVK